MIIHIWCPNCVADSGIKIVIENDSLFYYCKKCRNKWEAQDIMDLFDEVDFTDNNF